MNFRFPAPFRSAVLIVLAFLLAPAMVQAAGTLAGTPITNQAYATYKDANDNPMAQVYSNTVTTVVSQVAFVELVPNTGNTATTPGSTSGVSFLSQIFNRGNATDTYTFTYTIKAGSTFTPTVTFWYDRVNATSHQFDAGDPQILPVGGVYTTPVSAAPEDDVDVFVKAVAPVGVMTGQATIVVTAVSAFDGTKIAVGEYTMTVAGAVIVATKSVTPAKPAPGETLTYTIILKNNGTTQATSVIASDPLPLGITYTAGTIKVNNVAKTDANDGDGADFGVNVLNPRAGIYVNVGTIAPGAQVTISFQATVDMGIAAGTTITNKMSVGYNDGPTPIRIDSNGLTLFVGGTAGVDLTAGATAGSGDPGDRVAYPFTVRNAGNAVDLIDLTVSSSQGWTYEFYIDTNGDGVFDAGDTRLVDSDGDGKIDTGDIPAGTTMNLLAVATIPPGTPDKTADTSFITGTSDTTSTTTDQITVTTTTTAPLLTVAKTVNPAGSQPPGTILVYTVTVKNTGTGAATQVTINDPVPAHTTYQAGTLLSGSTEGTLQARTDADDGDGAKFEGGSRTIIVGGTGFNLGPNATIVVRFSVKID